MKINHSWKLSTSLKLEGYRRGGGARHLTTKEAATFFPNVVLGATAIIFNLSIIFILLHHDAWLV